MFFIFINHSPLITFPRSVQFNSAGHPPSWINNYCYIAWFQPWSLIFNLQPSRTSLECHCSFLLFCITLLQSIILREKKNNLPHFMLTCKFSIGSWCSHHWGIQQSDYPLFNCYLKHEMSLTIFPNTEKRVLNVTYNRIFLANFEVFGNVVKHCLECLVNPLNQN